MASSVAVVLMTVGLCQVIWLKPDIAVAAVTASPIAPNLRVRVCADLFSLVFIVFPFLFSVVFVFFQPVFWQPAAKIMAVQG
jgi:hypothetical protein